MPMTLSPIPWGKRDQELGFMLCDHAVQATPPIVLRWSLNEPRLIKLLHSHGFHDAKITDLTRLVTSSFKAPVEARLASLKASRTQRLLRLIPG